MASSFGEDKDCSSSGYFGLQTLKNEWKQKDHLPQTNAYAYQYLQVFPGVLPPSTPHCGIQCTQEGRVNPERIRRSWAFSPRSGIAGHVVFLCWTQFLEAGPS